MQITLVNCLTKLQTQGINPYIGSGVDTLCMRLQTIVPCQSWGYGFADDKLTIDVPDGTTIPAGLSAYGDVVAQ